jgi:dipeptidase E
MAGEPYLEYPKLYIKEFLGDKPIKALFIPYAGVTMTFDEYEAKVKARFNEIGHDIVGIHRSDNPVEAVEKAEAIVVGGGNTFNLAKMIQDNGLIDPIRKRAAEGMPYIGWSAGSNMACPTIRTTNDMPIIEPSSFNVLNLIPFQINPHYLDSHPDGHGGETREDRIMEFLELNKDMYVAGLREGCMFRMEGDDFKHVGDRACRIFKHGEETKELQSSDDFGFLL